MRMFVIAPVLAGALASYACGATVGTENRSDAENAASEESADSALALTDLLRCEHGCEPAGKQITVATDPDGYVPVYVTKRWVVDKTGRGSAVVDAVFRFNCGVNNGDLAEAFGYESSLVSRASTVTRNGLQLNGAPMLTLTCGDTSQISQVFRRIDLPTSNAGSDGGADGGVPNGDAVGDGGAIARDSHDASTLPDGGALNAAPYLVRFNDAPTLLFEVKNRELIENLADIGTDEASLQQNAIPITTDIVQSWGSSVEYRTLEYHAGTRTPRLLGAPSTALRLRASHYAFDPTMFDDAGAPSSSFDVERALQFSAPTPSMNWIEGRVGNKDGTPELFLFSDNHAFKIACSVANAEDVIRKFRFDPTDITTANANTEPFKAMLSSPGPDLSCNGALRAFDASNVNFGANAETMNVRDAVHIYDEMFGPFPTGSPLTARYLDFDGTGHALVHVGCNDAAEFFGGSVGAQQTFRVPEEAMPFAQMKSGAPNAVYRIRCAGDAFSQLVERIVFSTPTFVLQGSGNEFTAVHPSATGAAVLGALTNQALTNSALFAAHSGLVGTATISFESVANPGTYLRVAPQGGTYVKNDSTDAAREASFIAHLYGFESKAHPGQYVQITAEGVKLANKGAPGTQIASAAPTAFEHVGQLRSKLTNLCVEVKDGSKEDNVPLVLAACSSSDAQRFDTVFQPTNNPNYREMILVARHSGKCVQQGAGNDVVQMACSGDYMQHFHLTEPRTRWRMGSWGQTLTLESASPGIGSRVVAAPIDINDWSLQEFEGTEF